MEGLFRFLKPEMVVLVFVVPVVLVFRIWAMRRADARVAAFAELGTRWRIFPQPSTFRRVTAAILLSTGMAFLVATLMRPQGDPREMEVTAKGRDIVFLVDVSRSMLAQDLRPNRMQRAILAIRELVPILHDDRVGLVVFAGNVALKCPLSLDYEFFLAALERIGPDDVSQGGTSVGDALRVIADRILKEEEGTYQDIVLISDGEDHDSFALEAARELANRGVRIHAVGVGSLEGARIPDPERQGRYLAYKGETVHTTLNEELLKNIARTSGGSYLPARTGNLELFSLYRDIIVAGKEHTIQSGMKLQWREWFQLPLMLGLLLIALEAVVRGGRNV